MTAKRRRAPVPKRGGNRWVFPAVLTAIVVVGVVAVIIAAASGGGKHNKVGGKTVKVQTSAELAVSGTALPEYSADKADTAVGQEAPTLRGVDFSDRTVEAGGTTGSPYAMVFLAHWCPHCQAEVPRLVSLSRGGQIAGVDVIGVPTGTSSANPNYPPSEWLSREGWPYGVLLDDEQGTAARAYGLSAYPYFVFVDASGKVAGRMTGEVSEEQLTAIFEALAAGDPLPLPTGGASSPGG